MALFSALRTANPFYLCICVGLPYVGGALNVPTIFSNLGWYRALKKPPLFPPPWFCATVWTFLYGSMGLASYCVLKEGDEEVTVTLPLTLYSAQLLLFLSWAPVYFGLHKLKTSAGIMVANFASALLCAISFGQVNKTAGLLMIPQVLWVLFGTYLNVATAIINQKSFKYD